MLGCAIVGDKVYGGEDVGSGLFLAALELAVSHPARPPDAAPLHARIPCPRKFAELLTREHQRWQRLSGEAAAAG